VRPSARVSPIESNWRHLLALRREAVAEIGPHGIAQKTPRHRQPLSHVRDPILVISPRPGSVSPLRPACNTDYPELCSVVVYPSGFLVKTTRHLGSGVLEESHRARLGEAWQQGAVVLAWDAVCQGTAEPDDGHNVVFHEFAHQLDFEDGRADGAPVLSRGDAWSAQKSRYAAWARVLSAEFERLRAEVQTGKNAVLDGYGATDPAEFFAVATETFFERPLEIRERDPELYAELKEYYRQDPSQ